MADANDRLIRAARELLRWDQKMLAKEAGVGIATVRRFETGGRVEPETVEKIANALRRAGVAFSGLGELKSGIVEGVALTSAARPRERPPLRIYGSKAAAPSDG